MSVAAVSGTSMRTRFIALVAGTLVISIAWFALAYRPGSSKLASLKSQVETTRAEVSALEAKLAELQALQRDEKQLRAQAAKFAKALPATPAQSTFIRQIQKIATEARIDWVSVAPSLPAAPAAPAPAPAAPAAGAAPTTGEAPAPAAPPLRSITVSISAKGGFFAIENFIAKFEKLDRAVKINTFSLGGEPAALSLSLSVELFMGGAAPATTVSPPAAPAPGQGT